jgi:hypothetical protein
MNIVNPNATAAGNLQLGLVNKMANMPAYQAANVSSGYSTGPAYSASNVSSGYALGPGYDATKFETKDFDQDAAKRYMNPYLKESLDPQLAEARRQAEITRMTNAGRLVGSGAFGGGRQAIMEAEGDRNLETNLAGITGRGYDTAYTNAMSQFNADGTRRLQADQASEQSKQFGHSSGMTDRSNMANFGLQASKINEDSRQFGHSSSMTDRSNAANFGLQAANINETSRAAGARMGLDALNSAITGAGQYGTFLNNADSNSRANLQTIAGLGNDQYTRDQADINGNMARFNETAALPGQSIKLRQSTLQGLPIQTSVPISPNPTALEQLTGLGLTAAQIAEIFGEP